MGVFFKVQHLCLPACFPSLPKTILFLFCILFSMESRLDCMPPLLQKETQKNTEERAQLGASFPTPGAPRDQNTLPEISPREILLKNANCYGESPGRSCCSGGILWPEPTPQGIIHQPPPMAEKVPVDSEGGPVRDAGDPLILKSTPWEKDPTPLNGPGLGVEGGAEISGFPPQEILIPPLAQKLSDGARICSGWRKIMVNYTVKQHF